MGQDLPQASVLGSALPGNNPLAGIVGDFHVGVEGGVAVVEM